MPYVLNVYSEGCQLFPNKSRKKEKIVYCFVSSIFSSPKKAVEPTNLVLETYEKGHHPLLEKKKKFPLQLRLLTFLFQNLWNMQLKGIVWLNLKKVSSFFGAF